MQILVHYVQVKNITLNFTENVNSHASIEFIKNTKPDIIFCFGWSRILKEEILNLAPMGVLGYHPTKTPSNRGRHPLIWAIALGLKKTASTFFFMDRGADSGDVLSQKEVVIEYKDNAESLYQKIIDTSKIQLEEFLPKLISKNFEKHKQETTNVNYWRKRSFDDGCIDWRMPAESIHNLVRALSKPYEGAHFVYDDTFISMENRYYN